MNNIFNVVTRLTTFFYVDLYKINEKYIIKSPKYKSI